MDKFYITLSILDNKGEVVKYQFKTKKGKIFEYLDQYWGYEEVDKGIKVYHLRTGLIANEKIYGSIRHFSRVVNEKLGKDHPVFTSKTTMEINKRLIKTLLKNNKKEYVKKYLKQGG